MDIREVFVTVAGCVGFMKRGDAAPRSHKMTIGRAGGRCAGMAAPGGRHERAGARAGQRRAAGARAACRPRSRRPRRFLLLVLDRQHVGTVGGDVRGAGHQTASPETRRPTGCRRRCRRLFQSRCLVPSRSRRSACSRWCARRCRSPSTRTNRSRRCCRPSMSSAEAMSSSLPDEVNQLPRWTCRRCGRRPSSSPAATPCASRSRSR